METTIRPETTQDEEAIRAINVAAFRDHPVSRQTEHLIVDALRADGALGVSLVAEQGGRAVGHIAFSEAVAGDAESGWFLLGPVAVLPALQRCGIGSALVEAGLAAIRAKGARGCVLVGDPGFYERFGFRAYPGLGYEGVPGEYVLCLPFDGSAPEGLIRAHEAFEIEPEEASGGAVAAVVLDMDGLMFDTERLARDAWRRAMAERGFTLTDDVYLTAIGRTVKGACAAFVDALGPELPIAEIEGAKATYLRESLEPGPPPKPGLSELLDGLDDMGLPAAVASATARAEVERRLAGAGLAARFRAVCGGDEVARGKPSPDLFLLAAERLGSDPGDCVVLEDSEAGVLAAAAAGMAVILVPDLVAPSPEVRARATAVVPSLSEALPVIAGRHGS